MRPLLTWAIRSRACSTLIGDSAVEEQIEDLWQRGQDEVATSVGDATLTVVPGGHDIQILHPDAVVRAVDSVLAKARKQ